MFVIANTTPTLYPNTAFQLATSKINNIPAHFVHVCEFLCNVSYAVLCLLNKMEAGSREGLNKVALHPTYIDYK